MAALPWIQWTESGTGENHPTLVDVVNRPLKALLVNSGYAVNDDNPHFFSGANVVSAQPIVIDGSTAPPGAPVDGGLYLVDVGGTGVWNGHDKQIARWSASAATYTYFTPEEGWEIYVQSDNYRYRFDGTNWTSTLLFAGLTIGDGGLFMNSTVGTINLTAKFASITTNGVGFGFDVVAGYIELESANNINVLAGTDGTGNLTLSGAGGATQLDLLSTGLVLIGLVNSNWDPVDAAWHLGSQTQRWSRAAISSGITIWRTPSTIGSNVGYSLNNSSGGTQRWDILPVNAEVGDVGYDLVIQRTVGAGTNAWLTVTRATGAYAIVGDGTFTGNITAGTITATTRFTGPLFGTTTNVNVVFDRNSVTQLTLASLVATFAGTVIVSGASISVGTTPATGGGVILIPNATGIASRNAANSANVNLLNLTAGDNLSFGGAGVTGSIQFNTSTGTIWQFMTAGHFQPVADATYNIGASALAALTTFTRNIDSGAASDLLLKRNAVTQLTLGSLNAIFAGSLNVTGNMRVGSATTPSINTGFRLADLASTGANPTGLQIDPTFVATSTGFSITGSFTFKTVASAFTMTTGAAIFIETPTLGAGSVVTTGLGLSINAQTWTGSTTGYGIKIGNVTGATTNFALFTGLGKVQFGDLVNILSTTANQFQVSYDASNLWKFNVTSVGGMELLPTGTTFNLALFAAGSYGSGKGVTFIANATTVPSANPTGGGIAYVEAGALKYRGSAGTVTTLAPA